MECRSLSSILVLRDQPLYSLLQMFGTEKINILKAEIKKEIKFDILEDDVFNAISNSVRVKCSILNMMDFIYFMKWQEPIYLQHSMN